MDRDVMWDNDVPGRSHALDNCCGAVRLAAILDAVLLDGERTPASEHELE
jgi:hypothetical protein